MMKKQFKKKSIRFLSLITILCMNGITACKQDVKSNQEYIIAKTDTSSKNKMFSSDTSHPLPEQETIDDTQYRPIEIDGGDRNGHREANVKVDIGYGDRIYWAYTNEYGQLVKITTETIILQDEYTEAVSEDGRYYIDEAKVPGVEQPDLDEGHVIADSLGGVSNAYNITPQNSNLNRHGDQAYMEKVIRDADGCTDFTAIITYPDTKTQTPSHYDYTYTIRGNVIHDSFDNPHEHHEIETIPEKTKLEQPQPQLSNDTTVYYPPNGKSYHRNPHCHTLSRSRAVIESTIDKCGKTDACDYCFP